MTPKPIVAYSRRLSPVTRHEQILVDRLGAEVREVPLWTLAEIEEHAGDADAVIVGATETIDRPALHAMPRCRVVVRRGVGVNNVDLAAATDLGILVAYVPDASVQEVSDHALALVLALERRILTLDTLVRDGGLSGSRSDMIKARAGLRRLSELTLGVVGFGRIGREFVRKASPLFRRVLVFDPYAEAADSVELVHFDTLLCEADIFSIHAPLTNDTRHLFDEPALMMMKPGGTIVNTSRGGLIDSSALAAALRAGRVRAAGLDVTEVEPLAPDSDLLQLPHVVVTGHSAAMSDSSAAEMRTSAVDAVVDALQGHTPRFVANPAVLESTRYRIRTEGSTK